MSSDEPMSDVDENVTTQSIATTIPTPVSLQSGSDDEDDAADLETSSSLWLTGSPNKSDVSIEQFLSLCMVFYVG